VRDTPDVEALSRQYGPMVLRRCRRLLGDATLVLPAELEGRFFVRTAARELIVELYKPRGREAKLGVEPGAYEVRVEAQRVALMAKAQLTDGAVVVLDPRQFGAAAIEQTRPRGGFEGARYAVAGRNRIELRTGMWQIPHAADMITTGESAGGVFGGAQYTYYLQERLAVTATVQTVGAEAGASVGPDGIFSGTAGIVAAPIGVRWNPLRQSVPNVVKPYVAVSAGPVFGSTAGSFLGGGAVVTGMRTQVTAGGHAGAAVDVHVARWLSIGMNAGYNWMIDFAQPVGTRDNYSGPELGISFGWLFGRGRATP